MPVNLSPGNSGNAGKNYEYDFGVTPTPQPLVDQTANGVGPGVEFRGSPDDGLAGGPATVLPHPPAYGMPEGGKPFGEMVNGEIVYHEKSPDGPQQDILNEDRLNAYGPPEIFRGSPNTGICGGPNHGR